MKYLILLFLLFKFLCLIDASKIVRFNLVESDELKILPRFWTNTGFCPPAPINTNQTQQFFLSEDVQTNIELIGALPNYGLSSIRIHWLLNMLQLKSVNPLGEIIYDFSLLDEFMDHLMEVGINPVIELMGDPLHILESGSQTHEDSILFWKSLMKQLLQHYLGKYGKNKLSKWTFETWNEPDLKGYNIFNYSLEDYLKYVEIISTEIKTFNLENDLNLKLRGPAGLFKNKEKHYLCWGLLEYCNKYTNKCPIDTITFHRKGNGSAKSLINGTLQFFNEIKSNYPNLNEITFGNSEADPISGWSKPLKSYANIDYAITLVSIVFQYWSLMYDNSYPQIKFISHDNAFLSYFPYEFTQRTLLARFQYNLTKPQHVQFFQKPVYAAIGMLSFLGDYAGPMQAIPNSTFLHLSTIGNDRDKPYVCILIVPQEKYNAKQTNQVQFVFNFENELTRRGYDEKIAYIIEYLAENVTDPEIIWAQYGNPSYPNRKLRAKMRKAQGPKILDTGLIESSKHSLQFNFSSATRWIILIRVCSKSQPEAYNISNIRIRQVTRNEIILFWNLDSSDLRCVKQFEIFFMPLKKRKWINITKNQRVLFLNFQYQSNGPNATVYGQYKIRPIDIFNKHGQFSDGILHLGI